MSDPIKTLTEDEWTFERLGKATASEFHQAIAKTKSGWGSSRRNYAGRLVVERLTSKRYNGYRNLAMEWGVETEPMARIAYALETDVNPTYAEEGKRFWAPHPSIEMAGATPDALINDDGILELKCPYESGVHLEYFDEGINKSSYKTQGLFQLACLPERKWVDLVSYDPRMPIKMQLIVQRTYRQEVAAEIEQINADLTEFLHEIDERMRRYI